MVPHRSTTNNTSVGELPNRPARPESRGPALPGGSANSPAVRREEPAPPRSALLARFAGLVRLPHTLFALPFAGVGAVLASYTHPGGIGWATGLWIVVAFTAARFAAMGFNRIADRKYDALNPRTSERELPAGRLTVTQAAVAVAVASVVFVFAAWRLNPLCGMLSPVALAWVFFYSYTKRFTDWSHVVLGLSLGIAPVGAYLAVTGEWTAPWFALPVLALGVTLWVAGFDVVYALQDAEFDRAHGLHSLPASFGATTGLTLARAFHALAVLAFALLPLLPPFRVGALYLAGVGVMAVMLVYEHWLVKDQTGARLDLRRIDRAFFHANAAVSTGLFLFTLLDRVVLA